MATYTLKYGVYGSNLSTNSSYNIIDISAISGTIYMNTSGGNITLYNYAGQPLVLFNPKIQEIKLGNALYAFSVGTNNYITYQIDTMYLSGNIGYTSVNNEHFIGTDVYAETLATSIAFKNITSSGNIENLNLSGFKLSSSDIVLNTSNHTLSFTNSSTTTYLTDTITTSKQTITVDNASGTIQNINGTDTLLWTQYSMFSNESFKTLNNGMTITGSAGKETVEIASGMHNETISSNVEAIKLNGKYSDYSFGVSGASLVVKDASGAVVTTYNTATNASYTMMFNDGTHTLSNKSSAIYLDTSNLTSPASSTTKTTGSIAYTLAIDSFSDAYLTSSSITSCFKSAIADLSKYIAALGTLDIAVHFENVSGNVLAFYSGDGSNSLTSIPSAMQSSFKNATYATEFQLEQKTGVDYNGSTADMNITINLGQDKYLSTTNTATAGKYDLTTILEHEIVHGLGITGFIGTGSSASVKTEFDTYLNVSNQLSPYFYDGVNKISLAPSSTGAGSAYYHVAISGDLMNYAISAGQVVHISGTDLTILKDLGYNVTSTTVV